MRREIQRIEWSRSRSRCRIEIQWRRDRSRSKGRYGDSRSGELEKKEGATQIKIKLSRKKAERNYR